MVSIAPFAAGRMPRSPRYDRLTPGDCRLLHEASLTILERMGVVLHDAEAVERLHGAGARVTDDGRVHVPASPGAAAFRGGGTGHLGHPPAGRSSPRPAPIP